MWYFLGTRQCLGQSPCFSFLSGMFLSSVAFCASPVQIPLWATACCWKLEELASSQAWFSILGTDLLVTGDAGWWCWSRLGPLVPVGAGECLWGQNCPGCVSLLHAQGSTATLWTNGTASTGPGQSSRSIFSCLWESCGQGWCVFSLWDLWVMKAAMSLPWAAQSHQRMGQGQAAGLG